MISRRRLPSPGHVSLREDDEKEYKRQRLTGGRIGPSWTWPRSGGADPAGTLGGVEIPLLSALKFKNKGEQAQYTPDPDHLYLNATVAGKQVAIAGSSGVDPTSSVPATFDQTYDIVLLRKPSDFKMAVVRFLVPVSAIPIFYYPLKSCSVGITVGGIVYPQAVGGRTLGQQFVEVQTMDPSSDLPAGTPGYPLGAIAIWTLQQFIDAVNDAIYQVTAQMWQDQQANSANGWLGSAPGGPSLTFTAGTSHYANVGASRPDGEFAPHLAYDPVTSLCSLAYEQAYWHTNGGGQPVATYIPVWGQTPTATPQNGTANLYFNYNLYQTFFSTFPGFYTQSSQRTVLPTGLDVQILFKQTDQYQHPVEGSVVALNSFAGNGVVYTSVPAGAHTIVWTNQNVFTGVEVGDIVLVSGINSNTNANGAYVITQAQSQFGWTAFNTSGINGVTFTTGGGAGGTDQPSFIRIARWSQLPGQINVLTQETQTVSSWTSFTSLRLISFSIPVRPEYVSTSSVNPSGPGQQNPSGFFVQQTIQQPTGQYVTAAANSNAGLTQQATQTGTATVNTQTILVDFLPEDMQKLVLRDYISYTSRENYRWIDLIGDAPLQRFDVTAQWVDRFGNSFPLTVAPNETFDCKFLIQHKYS